MKILGVGMLLLGAIGFSLTMKSSAMGVAGGDELRGAWVQEDVKWAKAPHAVVPHSEEGEAEVLYFGKDQMFALIACVLNRGAKGRVTISAGEGQAIYVGSWSREGEEVGVSYRLVSKTAGGAGSGTGAGGAAVPGPMQQGSIKRVGEGLQMREKKFRRAKDLDEEAEEYARSGLGTL